MKNTEPLLKYINKCIIKDQEFDFEEFNDLLYKQDLPAEDRLHVLSLISKSKNNLTQINREMYDYFYEKEENAKYAKSMKKFERNIEDDAKIEEAYKQYENYVYSIISLKNYKSKMSKTQSKVKLFNIENLFGHDSEQTLKDVLQEGRLYLVEGLKKFGVLPDKAKNFEGRMDQGYQRNISSKSTFVHQNLKNSLLNLSLKSASDKFAFTPVEYKPETFGEQDLED